MLDDLTALGPKVGRNRVGLPRIIPARDRAYIRSGNRTVLRIWLTLFSLFRVLQWSAKKRPRIFRTIVEPASVDFTSVLEEFKVFSRDRFFRFIPHGESSPLVKASFRRNRLNEIPDENDFMTELKMDFFQLTKTSPTSGSGVSSSPQSIYDAAATWLSRPFTHLYQSLEA